MNPRHLLFGLFTILTPLAAQASTSANYTLEPAALDHGGQATTSANYRADSSGAPGAATSSVSYTLLTGFAGQLDAGVAYPNDGIPDAWKLQYFGLPPNATAAALADPDGDGFSNLQEYAFGMNPTQGTTSPVTWNGAAQVGGGVPTQLVTENDGTFTFLAVYARRKDYVSAHLIYTVEFSGDLLTWEASTATPSVLADNGQMQAVAVPDRFSAGGENARFFRVKVEGP